MYMCKSEQLTRTFKVLVLSQSDVPSVLSSVLRAGSLKLGVSRKHVPSYQASTGITEPVRPEYLSRRPVREPLNCILIIILLIRYILYWVFFMYCQCTEIVSKVFGPRNFVQGNLTQRKFVQGNLTQNILVQGNLTQKRLKHRNLTQW